VNFGHAGDGNIHTNIMFNKGSDEEKRAKDAMKEIFETVIEMGGSISGEHGIGITKQDFLEKQLGKETIDIFKRIKKALDPYNILNPHKMKLC
jgi:glycolate oxidase